MIRVQSYRPNYDDLFPPQGHDFLGRTLVSPEVVIFMDDALLVQLNWYPIERATERGGEILAAFELYLVGAI